MPTIRQMYNGVYTNYKNTFINGQLYRSSPLLKNSAPPTQNIYSLRSNYSALLSSYDTTKNKFYSELDDTMANLKSSAAKIKNYDFDVGKDAVTRSQTFDGKGNRVTKTTYSGELTNALKSVESFVSDYNDAINFFSDNSSVSKRVGRMAVNFGDTIYRAANYQSIGLVVESDGKMKIDEDRLVDAITTNPNKVSRILGRDGLAGKAESHIATASAMSGRFFPTAATMLGSDFAKASIYTNRAFLNMNSYSSIGNLLNLLW